MPPQPSPDQALRAENAELRARLEEAEEMLRAIRAGEGESLVAGSGSGPRLVAGQDPVSEQNRLRGAMPAQVSDAVITTDGEDRITFLNTAAEHLCRVRSAEVLGRKVTDLCTCQWPWPEAEAAALAVLEECCHRRGEKLHCTCGGRELPVEANIALLHDPATGERVGLIVAIRDITECRQAEAALRANMVRMSLATEATEVGIWEWNVLTKAIRWDAQMFRLYGVTPTADGLVGYETWRRAVLPEDLTRQEEVLLDTVARLGKSTREFRILRADDGECRSIQAVETVRANEAGKAEWVIGANLDVTERKNAERAVREAQGKGRGRKRGEGPVPRRAEPSGHAEVFGNVF